MSFVNGVPDEYAEVAARVRCCHCSATRAEGKVALHGVKVIATVFGPIRAFAGTCLKCGYQGIQWIVEQPQAAAEPQAEQPAREATGEDVPKVGWYDELMGRRS